MRTQNREKLTAITHNVVLAWQGYDQKTYYFKSVELENCIYFELYKKDKILVAFYIYFEKGVFQILESNCEEYKLIFKILTEDFGLLPRIYSI